MALSVNTVHSARQIHQWINGESTSLPIKRPTEQTIHLLFQPSNSKNWSIRVLIYSIQQNNTGGVAKQISAGAGHSKLLSLYCLELFQFSAGPYSLTRTRQMFWNPPSQASIIFRPILKASVARAPLHLVSFQLSFM